MMRRPCSVAVLVAILTFASPFVAFAQDDFDGAPDFWLSEDFVKDLAKQNTIQYSLSVKLEDRTSKVHTMANDCEIHIAGTTTKKLAEPSGVVVEPPNLCMERALKLESFSLREN